LLIIGKVCQIVDITKLKRNRNPDLEATKEKNKNNNDENNKNTYLGGNNNHKACKKPNLALIEGFDDGNNPHSISTTVPKGSTRVREDDDENMFFPIERARVQRELQFGERQPDRSRRQSSGHELAERQRRDLCSNEQWQPTECEELIEERQENAHKQSYGPHSEGPDW